MSDEDYARGWQDGAADRDPDPSRLAYGASRMNDYERGYVDGDGPPQRWPEGWAIPNIPSHPAGSNQGSEESSDVR
jgi:hypothetical protein